MANYTIRKGDTLNAIAARNGTTVSSIMASNPSISNANLIYAGNSLVIPGASASSSDKVPSPGLYTMSLPSIDLSPDRIKALEDKAYSELAPYYERILSEAKGDIELAKKRLKEDYDRGLRIKTEDVAYAIRTATEDVTLSKQELGDRLQYAKETLKYLDNTQFPLARKILDETYNKRGLFTSGLRTTGQRYLSEEQALQRQAQALSISGVENDITRQERYLTRTTEQQNQGLSRYKEEGTIGLTRADEDYKRYIERKQWELEQARRKEAVGMAQAQIANELANINISRRYGG